MTTPHVRHVKSLYKRSLRLLESWYDRRPNYRYHAVLMRKKFDDNTNIKDPRQVQQLIEEGERELFLKQHPQPRKFAMSPGGVAFDRVVTPPDWVLDFWHPLEKAQYPDYFARREERKKEFLKIWDSQYSKGTKEDHH